MAEEKKDKKEESKKKHAGHGVKETHIVHHHDGSHTMTQHHDDGRVMSAAKADLDDVHDHLEDTVGSPNEGENEPEPEPQAAPGSPSGAPMPAAQ